MNTGTENYIILESTYPHELLRRLSQLLRGNIKQLQAEDEFLALYRRTYPEAEQEISLLQIAYKQGIVQKFFEQVSRPEWSKRVFLETTLLRLLNEMTEKEAVMLLESLMFQFHWDMSVQISRQWENPPEERSEFHSKTEFDARKRSRYSQELHNRVSEQIQAVSEAADKVSERNVRPGRKMKRSGQVRQEREKNRKRNADALNEKIEDKRGSAKSKPDADMSTGIHIQKPEQARFYQQMNRKNRNILKKAIKGDVTSQCAMGDYYAEDDTKHTDVPEALKWYKLAAGGGSDRAVFEMGRLYSSNASDITNAREEAIRLFTDLAEKGFPTAQCVLGMKYWLGDGVENNPAKAVKWLELAAEQHHVAAIRHLGDLYASIQDDENAGKWYQVGAGYGDGYCLEKAKRKA